MEILEDIDFQDINSWQIHTPVGMIKLDDIPKAVRALIVVEIGYAIAARLPLSDRKKFAGHLRDLATAVEADNPLRDLPAKPSAWAIDSA